MAKNFIQPGNVITVTATADVKSGDVVVVGSLVGVANGKAASGEQLEISRHGVYEVPKVNAQAWTQGAEIYLVAASGLATTSAGSSPANTLIGIAADAAANPSTTGLVLLNA